MTTGKLFRTQPGNATYKLTMVVTACLYSMRSVQAQHRQNPSMETGGGHQAPHLAEALFANNSCGIGSHFPL